MLTGKVMRSELNLGAYAITSILDGTIPQVKSYLSASALGSHHDSVDIWAIGCIAAELMLGKPLFKGKE